ncbi:hypothetical protein MPLDJ20_140022 [Mesorhizobium plurifarium]|uniref:Uncharacterized protein n=1 Tax=Mesorhizobium plurifarium TaxID=69974 RepID=A0A090GGV0_MESPL|nr:hypothetical protein MPLDJ20_140022 [Mesorhizobium plurifarium]
MTNDKTEFLVRAPKRLQNLPLLGKPVARLPRRMRTRHGLVVASVTGTGWHAQRHPIESRMQSVWVRRRCDNTSIRARRTRGEENQHKLRTVAIQKSTPAVRRLVALLVNIYRTFAITTVDQPIGEPLLAPGCRRTR